MMPHAIYIAFIFALGACVGSFLNVVVWRLPRVQAVENENILKGFFRSLVALSDPPSHCPKCNKLLKWYDNLPVVGWLKLGGRCRFCKEPISVRYPIVEAITGLLFVGYYVAFFIFQVGPCAGVGPDGNIYHHPLFISHHYWLYGLDMVLLSGLLAASLIDAELFIIPIEIPWLLALIGVAVHTGFDRDSSPGNVMAGPLPAALALGAGLGLIVSFILLTLGVFPRAFAEGAPLLEVEREALAAHNREKSKNAKPGGKDAKLATSVEQETGEPREWSPREVRREIRKEMLFLLPPLFLGLICTFLVWKVPFIAERWSALMNQRWPGALLGSILGGVVGGFVVWLTRILGSLAFGREAMGMGDVDLMLGVGAVLGAGPATVAFFLAPFFGIAWAIYMLMTGKKRELPYGPYLSLASAFVMLFYCPIASYFAPSFSNLAWIMSRVIGGGDGS